MAGVSNGFQMFMQEAGEGGKAYMSFVQQLAQESSFDAKTRELMYIAVLAAVGMTGGIAFHVQSAKNAGATRDQVKSAILCGMPAVGIKIVDALPLALNAFDGE